MTRSKQIPLALGIGNKWCTYIPLNLPFQSSQTYPNSSKQKTIQRFLEWQINHASQAHWIYFKIKNATPRPHPPLTKKMVWKLDSFSLSNLSPPKKKGSQVSRSHLSHSGLPDRPGTFAWLFGTGWWTPHNQLHSSLVGFCFRFKTQWQWHKSISGEFEAFFFYLIQWFFQDPHSVLGREFTIGLLCTLGKLT